MEKKKERNNTTIMGKGRYLSPLALKEQLSSLTRPELSSLVREMDKDEREKAWSVLDTKRIAEILLDNDLPAPWFSRMSLKKQSQVASALETKDAEALLSSLPPEKRRSIIEITGKSFSPGILYGDDEVGSIMSGDFLVLPKDTTGGEALERIRGEAERKDNIMTIFLEGEDGKLYGEVDLLDVLRSDKGKNISHYALTSFPFVAAGEKIARTLEWIKEYNLSAFPVIDSDGKTIGIVTRHSLMDTVVKEMEEDYLKLASIHDKDSEKGVWASMKARLPWLMLLLALGTAVSAAIGALSSLALGLTLVFSFQSLLLDMTGNSGTQTLAVAVRALSGRKMTGKEKMKLLRKEFSAGVTSGLILGMASAVLLTPYIATVSSATWKYALFLALSISLALTGAMTLSNTLGALIPIFMDKAGADPAVASGPLITTLNDLVGATAYYSTVFLIMRKILGY